MQTPGVLQICGERRPSNPCDWRSAVPGSRGGVIGWLDGSGERLETHARRPVDALVVTISAAVPGSGARGLWMPGQERRRGQRREGGGCAE